MPRIDGDALARFARDLLAAGGLTASEAQQVATSLVGANLRGYDSHGVMRIPYYLQALRDGEMISQAPLEIVRESATHLVTDGHWGVGQVQAMSLLERLMQKASTSGLAVGTMQRSAHIGRLGEYAEAAAERGLVSMLMVNSHGGVVRVAPPGGKAPRLSTNPLALGVPHAAEPLILDFSTSATAEGKVRVKKIAGELCPAGWLIDAEGNPTRDPQALYGTPPGSILPMGGDQAYKGFGLGLMIEILTGALSGGQCARTVPTGNKGNCVFMLLLAPAHFGGVEHFAAEVQQLAEYIRSCPTIPGVEKILLPGDPERIAWQRNRESGIELDHENFAALEKLAAQLQVAVPSK